MRRFGLSRSTHFYVVTRNCCHFLLISESFNRLTKKDNRNNQHIVPEGEELIKIRLRPGTASKILPFVICTNQETQNRVVNRGVFGLVVN